MNAGQTWGRLLKAARAFMTNPVEAALYSPERISVRHDYPASYQPDPDWEVRLHGWLGAAWPCPERGMVDTLLHAGQSEASVARLLGVDRMTVRKWLGKR